MAKRTPPSKEDKQIIIQRQEGKCANSPGANLFRINNYICPQWKCCDGYFDDAGFEIDHIVEFSKSHDSSLDNLQALCPMCHTIKTKNFMREAPGRGTAAIINNSMNDATRRGTVDIVNNINNSIRDKNVPMISQNSHNNIIKIIEKNPQILININNNSKKSLNEKISCDEKNEDSCDEKNENGCYCSICDRTIARSNNFPRHLETLKHLKNLEKNNSSAKSLIIGNANGIINSVSQSSLKPVHNFKYHNIDDLTLVEQFSCLVNDEINNIPYENLLSQYNFNANKQEYQNIFAIPNSKNIEVFNGEEWVSRKKSNILDYIIKSKCDILRKIYNRFRIFLGNRYHNISITHIYNGTGGKIGYEKIKDFVLSHLYNQHGKYRERKISNDDISSDNKKDPIRKALTKTFTWSNVEEYITTMLELEIDFDKNLSSILEQLDNKIKNDPDKYKKYFNNLRHRIKFLIQRYNGSYAINNHDSSEDDELGKYISFTNYEKNKPVRPHISMVGDDKKKLKESKPKKKFIKTNQYPKTVRFIGDSQIGKGDPDDPDDE